MRRINSATVYLLAMLLMIGVLTIGSLTFLNQMDSNYILIHRGNEPIKYVMNHFKYGQNKKAFIFSVTFLISGLCFVIMIALPASEAKIAIKPKAVPQPVKKEREESAISAVIEPKPEPAEPKPQVDTIQPAPPTEAKEVPVAEPPAEIIEPVEELITDYEDVTEGEDDVVYGTGPISDAAIMHFVHKFPDSALKFLYRKQLDGKALTNVEEAIYLGWEDRNMTRGKVKGYILSMMEWKEFPKKPLYEIWKTIRDHIFENID